VREKARHIATIKSQEKITTHARMDWEEVVGRGTPKNRVEVPAEARAVVVTAAVREDRAGQVEKGEAGEPSASALPLPPLGEAAAVPPPALKLYRGREVRPGHWALGSHALQAGRMPEVPGGQPRQLLLCASAAAVSEEAKAA